MKNVVAHVSGVSHCEDVTPVVYDLSVGFQVKFKVLVLTYKFLVA